MVSLLRNICAGRAETGLVLQSRAVLKLIPHESRNLHLEMPKTPLCIHFHLIAVYECGHRRPINHKGSAVKDSYNCRRVTFILVTHQSYVGHFLRALVLVLLSLVFSSLKCTCLMPHVLKTWGPVMFKTLFLGNFQVTEL